MVNKHGYCIAIFIYSINVQFLYSHSRVFLIHLYVDYNHVAVGDCSIKLKQSMHVTPDDLSVQSSQ